MIDEEIDELTRDLEEEEAKSKKSSRLSKK